MKTAPPAAGRVYAHLVKSRNLAADRAMIAALPVAEPDWQAFMLNVLLKRGHNDILAELIEEFAHYPQPLQKMILAHAGELSGVLRVAVASTVRDRRLTAIRIVKDSGCLQLAWLLAGGLATPCPRTREESARVLETMATKLVREPEYLQGTFSRKNQKRNQRQQAAQSEIVLAVRQGLNCWASHHRPEVVRASMLLAEQLETEILEIADNPRARISKVFEESLPVSAEPELAPYLWRCLKSSRLREKAVRVLESSTNPKLFAALMDSAWVLSDPSVANQLFRIKKLRWIEQSLDSVTGFTPLQQTEAVKIIQRSGIPVESKIKTLEQLSNSSQPHLEEQAVFALCNIQHPDVTTVLRRLSDWLNSNLKKVVDWELMRRSRYAAGKPGDQRSQSYQTFDEWWEHLPMMNRHQIRESANSLKQENAGLERRIREKLASSDAQNKRQALHVVRTLSLTTHVPEQLYKLAHDHDPMIRSGVVKTLVSIDSPTTRRILRNLLGDADYRVISNVIEAMSELDMREERKEIEQLLASPNNRVRATAVRFLLKLEVRTAAQTLLDMLDKPSRADRLSALWVIENLPIKALTDHVQGMSRDDPDPGVRRRAERVLERLACEGDLIPELSEVRG